MTRVILTGDPRHINHQFNLCYDICDETNDARARFIADVARVCGRGDDPAAVHLAFLQPNVWCGRIASETHYPRAACARVSCGLFVLSLVAGAHETSLPAPGV